VNESRPAGLSQTRQGSLHEPGPTVVLNAHGQRRKVLWGHRWQVGTAAQWVALTECASLERVGLRRSGHKLGNTLREEVAACILGGFGMPFEMGLAAFHAVRRAGLLEERVAITASQIEEVLQSPLTIGGSSRRYRFPSQRAHRLAGSLKFLDGASPPENPVSVREWLRGAPGIGPKTASWVVRNHYACDEVAILDIHIMRAGLRAGIFDERWSVERDYPLIEAFFIAWAHHGGVRVSDLDSVIWSEQATLARIRQRTAV
jgi:N-glycosylase/DNA lyase